MKKIVSFIFLLFVSLIPTAVFANDSFKLEYESMGNVFLYEEKDVHYYANYAFEPNQYGLNIEYTLLYSLGTDGVEMKNERFLVGDVNEEFINSKRYKSLVTHYTNYNRDEIYYNNIFYFVDYTNGVFSNQSSTVNFDADLNFTKSILGDRYDIYLSIKDKYSYIIKIDVFENTYVVYYQDENYENKLDVYNKNEGLIITLSSTGRRSRLYAKEIDGIIYTMSSSSEIKTYKLDGTLIDTLNPSSNLFEKEFVVCGSYLIGDIEVSNDRLFVTYYFIECVEMRYVMNDEKDVLNNGKLGDVKTPSPFTQVYTLKYDIEEKQTEGGSFTYEEKANEDGDSFIQLNIVPEDGYIIDDIIVTDINNNRIEVTDNKFLKPMSDIKIEVKYKQGEYLPIPDTFLGMNVKSIIVGLILISVGGIIMYFNLNNNNVN